MLKKMTLQENIWIWQVSVCVCTRFYSHEMKRCKNVIHFYDEKIITNCIYLFFPLATKFAITLCLIKHQVAVVLQMTICTYKTPNIKPGQNWNFKEVHYPQEKALLIFHFYHKEQMKSLSVNISNPIWHLIFMEKLVVLFCLFVFFVFFLDHLNIVSLLVSW